MRELWEKMGAPHHHPGDFAAEVSMLAERVEKVLALHPACGLPAPGRLLPWCVRCSESWPCATVRALDGE